MEDSRHKIELLEGRNVFSRSKRRRFKLSEFVVASRVKSEGPGDRVEEVGLLVFGFPSTFGAFPQGAKDTPLLAEEGKNALVFSPGGASEDDTGLINDPSQVISRPV